MNATDDIRSLYEHDYLGQWDCDTSDLVLTITRVTRQEVLNPKTNKKAMKVCLGFKETDKLMVLNATNRDIIAKELGYGYKYPSWSGKQITLYVDPNVKVAGKKVGGIRIRAEFVKIPCTECGQLLAPGFGMSIEELAKYTEGKYGKVLCAECAQKEAKK